MTAYLDNMKEKYNWARVSNWTGSQWGRKWTPQVPGSSSKARGLIMGSMKQGSAESKRLSTTGESHLGFIFVPSMPGSLVLFSLWSHTISCGDRTGFDTVDHKQKFTRYFVTKKDLFRKIKRISSQYIQTGWATCMKKEQKESASSIQRRKGS